MEKKEVLIQTTNVFKTVKKKLILKNINLKLFSNKFHAFIGENGSGKSTLMNIITGDDLNYEGEVNIFLDNDKPNRSFLYFKTDLKFPQHLNSFNYIYNLSHLFLGKKLPKAIIYDKFKEYGLEDKMKSNPNNFSSGEKKKLVLLFVEIVNPKLVFLDEPESNLDPTARYFLYKKLLSIKENGSTIFISTHLINEIKDFVDYVSFIKDGEIIYSGDISNGEELVTKYKKIILESGKTKWNI